MATDRRAEVIWNGSLTEGSGPAGAIELVPEAI
jgi:hypothetical protein